MGSTPGNTKNAAPSFERRLLRALSVSSSTSSESQSSASSITGDTTEDWTHARNADAQPGDRQAGVKRQRTSNESVSPRGDQEPTTLSDEVERRYTIIFQYIVDLDIRVRRMERHTRDQNNLNHVVANELEDLMGRLAAIESAVQKTAEESSEGSED
ncbi:hypothetical protein N7478_000782 [Penicillium angulare]|uniref:uncharacterized protein n=1 Tax=Penicillium angulare TaxID=116970 RepID=UPI002541A167|nr:uncharacterized protein N7478_000690 [Penicillium angulare]XP_056784877.1 uncharacterized protein N7478_000782 [Penicillium angulare]KAJ5291439.1 hypothetical protein N7478_000690 [Penicillium angulare]KAJ5291531.1 hypothetical protein N7478_000782 [Penicillium angulare]